MEDNIKDKLIALVDEATEDNVEGGAMKNRWIEFLKMNAGKYDRRQLVEIYLSEKHAKERIELARQQMKEIDQMAKNMEKDDKIKKGKGIVGGGGSTGGKMNPWIKFMKIHKGKGLSMKQLRELYQKEDKGGILSLIL